MDYCRIAGQIFGIGAMFFNILSYSRKSSKGVIGFQFVGNTLFTFNYFMLGAFTGGFLNAVGMLRATVYINRKRFRSDNPLWLVFFTVLYITSYVLTFTVFKTDFNFKTATVEFLPVVGMVLQTVALRLETPEKIRKISLFYLPCWIFYNVLKLTIGGIICDSVSMCSSFVGIIKYDIKKRTES